MKPLKYGTLRYHLFKLLHGRALAEGKPVLLTGEQLRGAFPGGQAQHPGLPADYDIAEFWLLVGDTLTPAS